MNWMYVVLILGLSYPFFGLIALSMWTTYKENKEL